MVEAGDHLVEQALVAGQEARLERCRPDRHVGLGHADAIVDRAHGMTDLLAEVPQNVEDVLGDLLAPGRLLVGQDEQQIDVRTGRQRGAAIAAHGSQRHRLGFGRVGVGIDILGGELMDGSDDLVLGLAQVPGAAPALAGAQQFGLGGDACLGQRLLGLGQQGGPRLCRAGRVVADLVEHRGNDVLGAHVGEHGFGWRRLSLGDRHCGLS